MRKKFKIILISIFLLIVVIGVFFFFGISGGKRAQLLCRVTGEAWAECGSGCGPFTKENVDGRIRQIFWEWPKYYPEIKSYEEFKEKSLRGEIIVAEVCPDACVGQCICPVNKPYWSKIRGCIK